VVDPYAAASPAPVESTIRQLMDHEPTWDRVVRAAVESGVAPGEAELADRLSRFLDTPASELLNAATADGFIPGADRMRALLDN
jgi:alpha-L-rhamnosidase